jgi:hypothetical protein
MLRWCRVLLNTLFVCVVFVMAAFASARDVQLLLFKLYGIGVLLP